jgi:hypothetical protein
MLAVAVVAASTGSLPTPGRAQGALPFAGRRADAGPAVGRLNGHLLAFCQERIGRRVGRGQCADLPWEGLSAFGGQVPPPDPTFNADYVWGRLVCSLEGGVNVPEVTAGDRRQILPGDVVQFRSVRLEGAVPGGTYYLEYPHHTAVVERVAEDGQECHILDQHVGGREYVERTVLRLQDLRRGWMRFYRPVPVGRPVTLFGDEEDQLTYSQAVTAMLRVVSLLLPYGLEAGTPAVGRRIKSRSGKAGPAARRVPGSSGSR